MALLDVDEAYVASLNVAIQKCHSVVGYNYIKSKYLGLKCIKCRCDEGSLYCLSDMIFYLTFYDEKKDSPLNIHKLKEKAMKICGFSEKDLERIIAGVLFYEDGDLILDESGFFYFETE